MPDSEVDTRTPSRVGVLLINLGTPDGTTYWPMRRYLAEFLSDKRVIEWSRLYWYPILYGIVLTRRPSRSGANYDRIWNREKNESPLRTSQPRRASRCATSRASCCNGIQRLKPSAPAGGC